MNKTARVVNSHEPEPDGSGMLYGGAEVDMGMEAEAERSMLRTGVSVVVVNDGERTKDDGGGWWKTGATGLIESADKMKKRIVPYSRK